MTRSLHVDLDPFAEARWLHEGMTRHGIIISLYSILNPLAVSLIVCCFVVQLSRSPLMQTQASLKDGSILQSRTALGVPPWPQTEVMNL